MKSSWKKTHMLSTKRTVQKKKPLLEMQCIITSFLHRASWKWTLDGIFRLSFGSSLILSEDEGEKEDKNGFTDWNESLRGPRFRSSFLDVPKRDDFDAYPRRRRLRTRDGLVRKTVTLLPQCVRRLRRATGVTRSSYLSDKSRRAPRRNNGGYEPVSTYERRKYLRKFFWKKKNAFMTWKTT